MITWHSTLKVTPKSTSTLWGLVVTLIEEWPENEKRGIQDNFLSEMQVFYDKHVYDKRTKEKNNNRQALNIVWVSGNNIKVKNEIKPNLLMK